MELHREGKSPDEIRADKGIPPKSPSTDRLFPHVDAIRFLAHSLGCGGTDQDAESLGRLLATYIAHPNTAGATVLSLGCQKTQGGTARRTILTAVPVRRATGSVRFTAQRELRPPKNRNS